MYLRYTLLLFWILIGWGHSQEVDLRLTTEERTETLQKIQRLLAENYVFADTAEKCIRYIQQQIDEGVYDALTHPRAFVKRVNADLAKIHHDRHLRLSFVLPEAQRFEESQPDLALLTRSLDRKRENYGIREVKIYPENIGYLNLTAFEPLEMSQAYLVAAMKLLENTAAMIIDLRQNGGGNLNTVQFISSYFLNPPKLLFSYYWRRGDYTENYHVSDTIPGYRRPEVPIFILTGPASFSAAEEFAYSMQMQKRALLIGGRTGGGANPGYTFELSPRFSLFIPTGRAVNPVSGTNWEGTGVIPDIRVDPEKALNLALKQAGTEARTHQNLIDKKAADELFRLSELLERLRDDSTRVDPATLDSVLDRLAAQNLIDEWTIGTLGYHYLSQKYFPLAIALFTYNTGRFPDSANAFDSLGEAYYRTGDTENSRKNYQHSLLLDPDNQNAHYMLQKLEGKL